MATFDPRDDRQHGHAIRRRQGGRTSMYHDQWYPGSAPWWAYLDPGELEAAKKQVNVSAGIRGSDNATGAY